MAVTEAMEAGSGAAMEVVTGAVMGVMEASGAGTEAMEAMDVSGSYFMRLYNPVRNMEVCTNVDFSIFL